MSFSINTFTSDGVETQYPVSFPNGIYSRNHVKVFVEGDVDGTGAQVERAFTWINDGLIELAVAAPVGKRVTIRRIMNRDVHDIDYQDGAVLDETNLDQSNDQLLNLIQEIIDGASDTVQDNDLDMLGFDINNVGTLNTGTLNVNTIVLGGQTVDLNAVTGAGITRAATIAAAEALDVAAGEVILLTDPLRHGTFHVTATDYSAEYALDTNKGVYLQLSNGLYCKRALKKWLDPAWFGAVGDGVADDTAAIAATFAMAKELNIPVVGSGEFRLTGATDLLIYTDTRFHNTRFIEDGWTGKFIVSPTKLPVTYTLGSPEVTQLRNSTGVIKGSRKFNGVTSGSVMENSMCIIHTSQPFYWYRGAERTRDIFTRFYNVGITSNERLYDLDPLTIQSVDVHPLEDSYITVSGLNIHRLYNTAFDGGTIRVTRTRTRLTDIVFSNATGVQGPRGQIELSRTCDTVVSDVTGTITTDEPNYSLYYGESVNIQFIRVKGDGFGWGATGSNSCAIVTFNDCDLSRIDAHQPIFNDLNILNCRIGSNGIVITSIGDVRVIGGSISRSPSNFIGCISSRVDTTGFCDGTITLDGVRITGTEPVTVTNDDIMFRKQGDPLAYALSGSPIRQVFWNKITVSNCVIESPHSKFIIATSGPTLYFPEEITVTNTKVNTPAHEIRIDMGTFSRDTLPVTGSTFSTKLTFRDVDVGRISILNATNKTHRVYFVADGVYSTSVSGVGLETIMGGMYLFNNSVVSYIDSFNGGYPTTSISVKLTSGRFVPLSTAATSADYFVMQNHTDVTWCNMDLVYRDSSQQFFYDSTIPASQKALCTVRAY